MSDHRRSPLGEVDTCGGLAGVLLVGGAFLIFVVSVAKILIDRVIGEFFDLDV